LSSICIINRNIYRQGGGGISQQNINPTEPERKQLEHKIILLYLVDKIDVPISNTQIIKFAVEENFMNYYLVQKYLTEMAENGYLDGVRSGSSTRYTITDEGLKTLATFTSYISPNTKSRVAKYINEHLGAVKQDLEISATHFYQRDTDEFFVKCAVYDDDNMLMEINLSVVNKEQALQICNNWKDDEGRAYKEIIEILLMRETKDKGELSEDGKSY